MTIALLVAVLLAVVVGTALLWHQRPERVVAGLVRRRALVTLKDGRTFSGMLEKSDRVVIVLRDATLINDRGDPVSVDGVMLLHRADIAYIQLP